MGEEDTAGRVSFAGARLAWGDLRGPSRCDSGDTHVHEEELHLQLGDAAAQALARPEAEAEPLEVFGAGGEPALRHELLRPREHRGVAAHGVQPHLHQRLRGAEPWGTRGQ